MLPRGNLPDGFGARERRVHICERGRSCGWSSLGGMRAWEESGAGAAGEAAAAGEEYSETQCEMVVKIDTDFIQLLSVVAGV